VQAVRSALTCIQFEAPGHTRLEALERAAMKIDRPIGPKDCILCGCEFWRDLCMELGPRAEFREPQKEKRCSGCGAPTADVMHKSHRCFYCGSDLGHSEEGHPLGYRTLMLFLCGRQMPVIYDHNIEPEIAVIQIDGCQVWVR
jgi:hypothetical protein